MSDRESLVREMQEEINKEENKEEVSKEEKNEAKREERKKKATALWDSVQKGENKHLIQKVASIMNKYPATRDSDIALQIKYWEVFENKKGNTILLKDLFDLERLTSITRTRQKVQNEYGLFPASDKTKRYRKNKEEKEKEYQISLKPEMPIIHIYADETGKNDKYIIVGSIWVLDSKRHGEIDEKIVKWVKQNKSNVPSEFHFNAVKNNGNNLDIYKEFFNLIIGQGDVLSFRAIAVEKAKLTTSIDDTISSLFYQIARLGLEQEKTNNRISLPKQISYIKDAEKGEGSYRITQIKQNVVDNLRLHYEGEVTLNNFYPLDSKLSRFIQIADLFAGSLNRKYNHQPKGKERNAKDELANYIVDIIDLQEIKYPIENLDKDQEDKPESDMSTIYIFE